MFLKFSTLLGCLTIWLSEYEAVDDGMSTTQTLTEKEKLEIINKPTDYGYVDSEEISN